MKSDIENSFPLNSYRRIVPNTPLIHWIIAAFLLVIQQNSYVLLPLIMTDSKPLSREAENPLNTIGITISLILLIITCAPIYKEIYVIASRNRAAMFYMFIVLISGLWSIHPDTSIRRGIAYIITLFVTFYICIRFSINDRMKVLSWSFAVSAFGSLVFIVVFPQYGIMHGIDATGDLDGNWRGVFSHKNLLGFVMAAAVFTELYFVALENGKISWRYITTSIYFILILLSRSTTALITSSIYISCTCIYLIWKRNKIIATCIFILSVSTLCSVFVFFRIDPDFMFRLIGKDPSLTGRTDVWSLVIELIEEKPLLGWGYRAMWQPDDAITQRIDDMTGNWGVPSAHNAFLEVTLELGLVGFFVLLAILIIALWRGVQCCLMGILPLGWFALMFTIGAILAGLTIETLGLNQVIEWVLVNILSFSCQQSLDSKRRYLPG